MVRRKKKTSKPKPEPELTVDETPNADDYNALRSDTIITLSTSDLPEPIVDCGAILRDLYSLAPKPLTLHWTRKIVSEFRRQYNKFYKQLGELAK